MADARAKQPPFFSHQVRTARRFFLDLSRSPPRGLAVVCGGFEACAPDYVIHRDSFSYYTLEFVSGGRGTLELAGRRTELSPGVVYAYGPTTPHRIASDARAPLEKYFVDFSGGAARGALRTAGLSPGAARRVLALHDLQRALDDLIRHGSRPDSATLCDSLLPYILALVANQGTPEEAAHAPAFASYQRCRSYIEANYLRLRSLEDAARELAVSKAYLCRLFQRFDRQTPHQYLTRLRMNHAAELLMNSSRLVKQVAAATGYDDVFHFSRIFKSVFGVSPQHFREIRG